MKNYEIDLRKTALVFTNKLLNLQHGERLLIYTELNMESKLLNATLRFKLSDSFKVVIARSGATWQSLSVKTRFLTEFILSSKIRFLTAFGMTGEGFGMTILNGLYIKIAQFR
jgi:hypothetical protein